jgi:hypothetical protein
LSKSMNIADKQTPAFPGSIAYTPLYTGCRQVNGTPAILFTRKDAPAFALFAK